MKRIVLILGLLGVINASKINGQGEQQKEKAPNVLIAISDDQSFQHTSFAGCSFINTPAFDRVAAEGAYFSNCIAGSPGCAPSRSTLITGRFHWQNKEAGQHASHWIKEVVPMTDEFMLIGYQLGRTGKGVAPFRYGAPYRKTDAAGVANDESRYSNNSDEKPIASGINKINYFENFKRFMQERDRSKPFFFWFGAHEPHRSFEKGSWKRVGKRLKDVKVPGFLPDDAIIRGDLLDYAVEIEWFDSHLQKMLNLLKEEGELDNTIVIVTSDNGMAFPRAKANCFEYGIHVPLAIRYPKVIAEKRKVDDVVSFADFVPTLFDLCGINPRKMLPISGESITDILEAESSGKVNTNKQYVFAGRERHSCSRYKNWGYPQRAVRDQQYLLIWNITPQRWPAGAPQRLMKENGVECYPYFGLDDSGKHHSEWAFTDVDAAPSKSFMVENKDQFPEYFDWSYSKRPEFEFYDIKQDPYCLNNLAGKKEYCQDEERLKKVLIEKLKVTKDPRVVGKGKEKAIFDSYPRYSRMRYFPNPESLDK
ncbi:MAG: sulfatase [Carboxylicivirga sp.]|jgi:uncharacterized sulfatase|nr:sulfatase [Carboxylicivirga sp.]